ncbi:hypothetical protein ACELLULO517_02420 [Acidisoma cellulosilytica]|uniref:Uncharacterized protein n=1 Tax=Acidisoma cellulosilyticum TaxID=2802395 RepID=A0A963YXP1_9PROT|nr:hypothetical protein [Acidisoma cellulosilyticum]MCB8879073.1 hypothetical protein [Acidisoma cellulosilyticum]
MSDSALTKNRQILSHLRPFNLQIQIQDSVYWGVLSQYRWNLGMSDFDGDIIYDYKKTPFGTLQSVNEAGVIVYRRVMGDPRGGLVTLVGTYFGPSGYWGDPTSKNAGNHFPGQLIQSARYSRPSDNHIVFQISAIRATETSTNIGPGNKVSAGVKGGGDIGVVNVEGSGGYEHTFATQTEAATLAGKLIGIMLVWVRK